MGFLLAIIVCAFPMLVVVPLLFGLTVAGMLLIIAVPAILIIALVQAAREKLSKKQKAIILSIVICAPVIAGIVVSANHTSERNEVIAKFTQVAESYGLENVKVEYTGQYSGYSIDRYDLSCSNFETLSTSRMYSLANALDDAVTGALIDNYKSNGDTYVIYPYTKSIRKNGTTIHDDYYHSDSYTYVPKSVDGRCALSYCSRMAQDGKPYCGTHGCCKPGCNNQKDPGAHCCNTHCCKYKGCGSHRNDYTGSVYCRVHDH